MSLRQEIQTAQTQAMKAGDSLRLSTLRLLWSAIRNAEIDKRKSSSSIPQELTDDEVQTVVAKLLKQWHDALVDFGRAGRGDLIAKTKSEIALLETYAPPSLTEEELKSIIADIIEKNVPKGQVEIGKIIGLVMKVVAGRADGTRVKTLLMTRLSGM